MRAIRVAALLAVLVPVGVAAAVQDAGATTPVAAPVAPVANATNPATATTATPAAPSAPGKRAPPPPACQGPEYRQFDFWLGAWNVFGPKGKQVGSSRIESILGGCVIAEAWTSGSGPAGDGRSHNLYDARTRHWEQFWVDASGSRLVLAGGLVGKAMVLEGEQPVADPKTGKRQRDRITWTPNGDGSVRQLWESSTDGGATWSVAFDGMYRHAPAAP